MSAAAGEVGTFTTDRELVVRSWDGWMQGATGIPAEAACGRPLVELFPDVEARGFVARLRRVASEGVVDVLAPAFHHYLIPCPPLRPAAHFARMQQHVTLSPLHAGGEVVGVTIAIRDVTERREGERVIAERLRSGDEGMRLRAVEALAAAEASPDVLVGAFDDASWRVRRTAVEAVAHHAGEGVVEVLTRVLREQHRDLGVLNATLSALAESGEEVLPPLLELLASPDADLRVYVALALGLRGDARAVPALVGALGDSDDNVRFHALEALGRLRARPAAGAIAEVAESRDFAVAFAALDALGAIGDETVAPRILPLLDDELLRSPALAALGQLGGEEAVAPLAALLAQGDVDAAEVAEALAAIHARYDDGFGDGEVIARLAGAITPDEGGRRVAAALAAEGGAARAALARVLGWLRVDGGAEALVRALAHADARTAAVEGLVRLGSAAVDPLVRELGSLEDDALRGAVLALGRIGSPAAVPALLALLGEAPELAAPVAEALGAIGDARASEPLIELLDHPGAAVRQAAVGALSSVAHPALRGRVCELLGSPVPAVRECAVRIAGYFGYGECAGRLLALCHDADQGVRRAAVEHLACIDDPRIVPALAEALASDPGATRAAAARATARLAPAQAAALLPGALADADLWVRYYAARSAGALGLAALVPRLAELATDDPAVPVRAAAALALGAIGAAEAVPVLAALARDPEPDLALPAVAALGRTAHPAAVQALAAALESDDDALRRAALDGLAPAAAAALVGEIARAARGTRDAGVAGAAAVALLRAGSADAVRALCALAAEPALREIAVQALARVADAHLEVLAGQLREGGEAVREAILAALAHRPGGERLAAVALGDPAEAVRRAAALALTRLDLRSATGRAWDG